MEHLEEFDWINVVFLEKVMRSYKNDDTIQVITFKIKPCFQEHFASIMFPCQIEFKSSKYPKSELERVNVIVKSKPNNEAGKRITFTDGPLFDNEILMYSVTIPAINQLFERIGMKTKLAPE